MANVVSSVLFRLRGIRFVGGRGWRAAGPSCANRSLGDGWESAGQSYMEREQRREFIQREAWDLFRRALFAGCESDNDQRYRCELDERHDLLLCRFSGEFGRGECEFGRSIGDAFRSAVSSERTIGNGRKSASQPDLEREHRSDELSREAKHKFRRSVHDGGESDHSE